MKKYCTSYCFLIILAVTIFISCKKTEKVSTPKSSFEVFKGASISRRASDTIRLVEVPSRTFKLTDTIIFKNSSTGSYSSIYTGDTLFNSNGSISGARIADQPQSRFLDVITGQTVNVTAAYFPKPNIDLEAEYGTSGRKIYRDINGQFYTGIYPYRYSRIGRYKVKSYTYNWDEDGRALIDTSVVFLTVVR
nr:hypothetical protein [Pedobacter glucosidilyticus]